MPLAGKKATMYYSVVVTFYATPEKRNDPPFGCAFGTFAINWSSLSIPVGSFLSVSYNLGILMDDRHIHLVSCAHLQHTGLKYKDLAFGIGFLKWGEGHKMVIQYACSNMVDRGFYFNILLFLGATKLLHLSSECREINSIAEDKCNEPLYLWPTNCISPWPN